MKNIIFSPFVIFFFVLTVAYTQNNNIQQPEKGISSTHENTSKDVKYPNPPTSLTANLNQSSGEVELNWNYSSGNGINEDFEDGVADNWIPVAGIWSASGGIYNGESSTHLISSSYYNEDFSSFECETRMRITSGSGNLFGGLYFNGEPFINSEGKWKNSYSVRYNTNGTWALIEYDDNWDYTFIQDWIYSSNINTGIGSWNTIKVVFANGSIDVYFNDVLQGSYYDDTFLSGKVGLKFHNSDILGTAEFDYVTLSEVAKGYTFGKVNQSKFRDVYSMESNTDNDPNLYGLVTGQELVPIPQYEGQYTYTGENTKDFLHFKIYRDLVQIGTSTVATYSDLLPGYGIYDYEVTAFYDEGESPPAGPVEVDYSLDIDPPYNLTAELEQSTGGVELNWNYGIGEGFYEDFEDGVADNWEVIEGDWDVSDGKYWSYTNSSQSYYSASEFENFEIETSFIRNTGDEGVGVGIHFRHIDENNQYFAYVWSNGRARIGYKFEGSWSVWYDDINSAVNQGLGAENIIKVSCVGNEINFWVNGIFIWGGTDSYFESGFVVLRADGDGDKYYEYVSVIPLAKNDVVISSNETSSFPISKSNNNDLNPNGSVKIEKDYPPIKLNTKEFQYFNIYRDGFIVATSTETTYDEVLPDYGTYNYEVTAWYDEGESEPAGPAEVIFSLNLNPPYNLTANLEQSTGAVELNWNYGIGAGFFDDFSDGVADNWVSVDGNWSASGDTYNVSTDIYSVSSSYYNADFVNFEYEVKLRKTSGSENVIGICFNGEPIAGGDYGAWENTYQLHYSTYGEWMLFKYEEWNSTFIQEWTGSDDLNLGIGSWNILKVVFADGNMDVYFNGVLQGTYYDDTYSSGKVGLMMYDNYTNGNAEYDYVSLSEISKGYTFGTVSQSKYRNVYSINSQNIYNPGLPETIVGQELAPIPRYEGKYSYSGENTKEFQYFKIYRDLIQIGTSSETSYLDYLPVYGTYDYEVTAWYDEGESTPAGPVEVNYYLDVDPPTNLLANLEQTTGEVELNWNYGVGDGFSEDFDDGIADNWIPVDGTWSVSSGTYNVQSSTYHSSSSYYDQDFSNFEFEVKLRKTSGSVNNIGLLFNGEPNPNGEGKWQNTYQLHYGTDGDWTLYKYIDWDYVFIQNWTYSNDLNQGLGAWNIIKLVFANGYMDVYFNDILQGTYFDDTFSSGKVGLKLYDADIAGTAEFDYASLSTITEGYTFGKINQSKFRDIYSADSQNENDSDMPGLVIGQELAPIPPYEGKYSYSDENTKEFQFFKIYRDLIQIGTSNETSYLDYLPVYGTYDYEVTAWYDEGESDPAGPVEVNYYLDVEPPTNLSANLDESAGEVELNWNYGAGDGFYENFDDGVADNFIFSDDLFMVSNGSLIMNGISDGTWASTYYDAIFDDFTMEFEVTRNQSEYTQSNSTGAFIRADGFMSDSLSSNGYLININANGSYGAWVAVNGSFDNLLPWTASSYLNTGLGASNIVTIQAQGPNIDIFINGNYVDGFVDNTFSEGFVNVATYDAPEGPNEVAWDYISLIPDSKLVDQKITKYVPSQKKTAGGDITRSFGDLIINPPVLVNGFLTNISFNDYLSFQHFNIYRDGIIIGTTIENTFTDVLSYYGTYNYEVTAWYDEGESMPAGPEIILWEGDPNITVTPEVLNETLEIDDYSIQNLTINNNGEGGLYFDITVSSPNNNIVDVTTPPKNKTRKANYLSKDDASRPGFIKGSLSNKDASKNLIIIADKCNGPKSIFQDDFEDGDFDGWIDLGSGIKEVTNTTAANGTVYSYHEYASPDGADDGIVQNITSSQPEYISFYLRSGSETDADAYFVPRSSSGGFPLWIYADPSGQIVIGGSSWDMEVGSYISYTWYHAEFKNIDWINYSFDFCLDGTLIATNLLLGATDIESIYLYNFNSGSEAWWDEIYLGDEINLDWLSISPVTGTVPVNSQTNIEVFFDATGLTPGIYTADIHISSNDPDQPLVTVPVTLTVIDYQPPAVPSNPSPENQAIAVSLDAELSWALSNNTGTIDLYFGTNNPPTDLILDNVAAISAYDPESLDFETNYYWKVVASNNLGVIEGPVWSFMTDSEQLPPDVPSNPLPENLATSVSEDTYLSWTISSNTETIDLYFGTDNPPTTLVLDNVPAVSYYELENLDYETDYYWKVVSRNNIGSIEGPIWSFTTLSNAGIQNGEEVNNLFILYPNPAKDKLFVETKNLTGSDIVIEILNINGKAIYSKTISTNDLITIDTDNIKKGVYLIQLRNEKYFQTNKLIIK